MTSNMTFDKTSNIRAEQVYSGIKTVLSENEYAAVTAIGQFASTKNWTIQFNDESAFNSSLNKVIIINETSTALYDANEYGKPTGYASKRVYTMTVFYRIHWLPSEFSRDENL